MRRLVPFVLIAACGGVGGSTDVQPTLRFADRSDVEIARLVNAASASEGFQAESELFQFDSPAQPDPCPTIVEDFAANQVTITGGCTTQDGTTISGTAILTNPTGWGETLEYDFSKSSDYEFQGFALQGQGGTMSWDGFFTIAGFTKYDLDLTTDSFGVAVRSDIFMKCSQTSCELGNSGLELVGVGGALVSGTIGIAGQTANGSLTLEGVDTLKVNIANNCVAWSIDGTDRAKVCQ